MESSPGFFSRLGDWGPYRFLATRLRHKILLGLLIGSLLPLGLLAVMLYTQTSDALLQQTYSHLESVRQAKAEQLETHFENVALQMRTFSEDPSVQEAALGMSRAFQTAREEIDVSEEQLTEMRQALKGYYAGAFASEYQNRTGEAVPPAEEMVAELNADAVFLQHQYIEDNPHSLREKRVYDGADDRSTYANLHRRFHPRFRSYAASFGFADVMLVDAETGEVVYSVQKGPDLGTSLLSGRYAESNLSRAFREAAAADRPGMLSLVDFEAYTGAFRQPTGFIAAPVFDGDRKIGVAVFQLSIEPVNAILTERAGLGETGETYVVGQEGLFRSDSRFLDDLDVRTTVLSSQHIVRTAATTQAASGDSGAGLVRGYLGNPVVSAFAPLTIRPPQPNNPVEGENAEVTSGTTTSGTTTSGTTTSGTTTSGTTTSGTTVETPAFQWALVSEMDLDEVRAPINEMLWKSLAIAGVIALAALLLCIAITRNITRQANEITGMLDQVGIGNFDARAEVLSRDELGTIAISLNSLCDNTLSLIQSREERDEIEAAVAKLKQEVAIVASGDLTIEARVTEDLTGDIADSVNYMVAQLREIIANVQDATIQVSGSANGIRQKTEQLSAGSEAQSQQILHTSAAVEEMAKSIQSVSGQTRTSADVAGKARETAKRGHDAVGNTISGMDRIRDQVQDCAKRIKRLGETSQEVGEIVQLIADIADRTSILALNASIQAAMAGEAGQGFAVVAEEIERLAERCNDATRQIGTLIKAIQGDTAEAISAMEESTREVVAGSEIAHEAGDALQQIDTVSQELAELIESVSFSTTQQARNAEAVAKSMRDIAEVTRATSTGTKETAVSVSRLAELADQLHGSVSAFKLPAAFDEDYVFDMEPPSTTPETQTQYSGILLKEPREFDV